jgi:hypothetical protein
MRSTTTFLAETKRLNAIANDPTVPVMERIRTLCHLYRWHQNDVHNQAKFVRQIEELAKTHDKN